MNVTSLKEHPRLVFLLDGVGALISSFFLGIILVAYQKHIGLPIDILLLLAFLALGFSFYSLFCYFIFPKNWRFFLRLIAILNTAYCLLTISLSIHHIKQLTSLGLGYFSIEVIIILLLVLLEFRVANQT